MMKIHFPVISSCCLLFFARTVYGGAGWEYDGELGPDKWGDTYPRCKGRMQSPINLELDKLVYDPHLKFFDFSQYHQLHGRTMMLENIQGHTAEVKYSGDPITITGGSLPDEYILDQFHFHWGVKDDIGSEHKLNGNTAAMEMHIVHHMKHMNKSESAMNPYGLAVLGFFFKVGEHNENFTKLLSYFPNITHMDENVTMAPFALSDLLPPHAQYYYRYLGSLTTPPCYETVIWTIFKEQIEISHEQLSTFRTLRTKLSPNSSEVLVRNEFRPVQPLHDRELTTNNPDSVSRATGCHRRNALPAAILWTLFLWLQTLL